MREDQRRVEAVNYAGWVLAAGGVGAAGYLGYVTFPRFGMPAGSGAGLLVLAAAAGIASFFSPCSFPLLVSMLARPLTAETTRRPLVRASAFAAALSLGAAAFLALLGGLLALGAGTVFGDVTFGSTSGRVLRAAVGALLITLGLVQTNRIRLNLRRFESGIHGVLGRLAGLRRRRPLTGFALFGFVYLLAGFG